MSGSLSVCDAMRMPVAGEGARIGLFGGSFNPPHKGHINLCDIALRKLELDQIWWIVSPGNPLKDTTKLKSLEERLKLCNEMAAHPKIKITCFEVRYETRFTIDMLRLVKRYRSRQKFVWLMGADNLAEFHKWKDWREIVHMMPIAVIDRPGSTLSFQSALAAHYLSKYRLDESDGRLLAYKKPPAWTFLHGPRNSLSSTQLRAKESK